GCRLVQVYCTADDATLLESFRARWEMGQRHPGHLDDLTLADMAANLREHVYSPLALVGPLLRVDTTDPAAVDVGVIIKVVAETLST
ncbi:MAG: hypothetical protein V1772_08035, partial [Chloroflexota bacterium]